MSNLMKGKVINFIPFLASRQGPIEVSGDEVNMVLDAFFGIPFRVFSVLDDNGDEVAYCALPGSPEPDAPLSIEEQAAINWTELFEHREFETVDGIITTFMDCVIEQREIQKAFCDASKSRTHLTKK